jgi:DNA-binding transcriptional regulator YiaG
MIYVEIPGRWVTKDRGGETAFLPPAVRLLDRMKVLAMSLTSRPVTPGYLKSLREALGLTQAQMGERAGVDKMTVWRWEQGRLKPSKGSLAALENLRKAAARQGVMIQI